MARIGWDLDGVGYGFKEANCLWEAARGNTHRSLEASHKNWTYYKGWGMSTEEWLKSYAEAVDDGYLLWQGEPLPNFVAVAEQFRKDGHTNHVITDRSIGKEPEVATKFWLDEIKFPYDSLDFSPDKTIVPTDFFIEDKVENADALNEAGTLAFLINRSWNEPHDDGRIRVDTLWEFYDRVNLQLQDWRRYGAVV